MFSGKSMGIAQACLKGGMAWMPFSGGDAPSGGDAIPPSPSRMLATPASQPPARHTCMHGAAEWKSAARAAGRDMIDLSVGASDLPPPQEPLETLRVRERGLVLVLVLVLVAAGVFRLQGPWECGGRGHCWGIAGSAHLASRELRHAQGIG